MNEIASSCPSSQARESSPSWSGDRIQGRGRRGVVLHFRARLTADAQRRFPFEPIARRHRGGRVSGFTLIEFVGVLALTAMLVAVIAPSTARSFQRARAEKEDRALATLAEGLVQVVRTHQRVPGAKTWIQDLALQVGWSPDQVMYVDPLKKPDQRLSSAAETISSYARVYLIHPGFTPTNVHTLDPLWTQTAQLTPEVQQTRILLLSSLKPNLPLPLQSGRAASADVFEMLWQWTLNPDTRAPPRQWPAVWAGQGAFLRMHRINLASEFKRVTFSNLEFPKSYPLIRWNGGDLQKLFQQAAVDTWCLKGTRIALYPPEGLTTPIQISHTVVEDVNFAYANGAWHYP